MEQEYSYPKLRGRITEKFGSQSRFAKALGVCLMTVSRKLNGRAAFTREDMLIWSELLGIDRGDIGNYFFD